jgi:hypothetical protein
MIIRRSFDALAAVIILTVIAPLFLFLSLFVLASVGYPVLFWQRRTGPGGRPFHLYKFRTLRAAHARDGTMLSDAERLSAVGNFIRRTRLDELPQLFNVLRGDMSFAGPRPLPLRDQARNKNSTISAAPGSLVLKIAEFLCTEKIYERVFLQSIVSMREEYFEALAEGRDEKAQWVKVRGYLWLIWTVTRQIAVSVLSGPVEILKSLWG